MVLNRTFSREHFLYQIINISMDYIILKLLNSYSTDIKLLNESVAENQNVLVQYNQLLVLEVEI